jgi:hypothetical protein
VSFLAHHSHVATSHKRKKCNKKKFYFLPHENTTHIREKRDAAKKEKRKKRKEEKEEGRPRCRAAGHRDPPLGLTDPRYFLFYFILLLLFFSFPFGDLGKDFAHDQTPCG